MSQSGFFDFEERLSRLSRAGDPLEGLLQSVDFEIFRRSPCEGPEIFWSPPGWSSAP